MLNLGHLGHPRCSKWIPWGPLWGGKLVFGSLLGALFDQLLVWCHFWLIFGLIFEHIGAKFGSVLAPTWTNDARKRMPRIHMKKQHVFNSKFMRRRCVRGEKMCVSLVNTNVSQCRRFPTNPRIHVILCCFRVVFSYILRRK